MLGDTLKFTTSDPRRHAVDRHASAARTTDGRP